MSLSRLLTAAVCTVLFACSWSAVQTQDNMFWFGLSWESYLSHLGIWAGLAAALYAALAMAGRRSPGAETRLGWMFGALSLINILDYGMRAAFGPTGGWSTGVLILGGVLTLLPFLLAAAAFLRRGTSAPLLRKLVRAALVPCLFIIWHALPGDFPLLRVERPRRASTLPPIHLLLFDMLSYDFLTPEGSVPDRYPHFKAFAAEADVFSAPRAPAGITIPTVLRLLTGIDFEATSRDAFHMTVKTRGASEWRPVSSFETIFSIADAAGYDVFLQAYNLPYIENFQRHIQKGRYHRFNSLWRAGMHSMIWPLLSPGGLAHQASAAAIAREYALRAKEDPRGTLFYSHWNIPHDPLVYGPRGTPLSRFELAKGLVVPPDRRAAYGSQVAGTDARFGEVIAAMKAGGAYDESLVIVTSDHNVAGFGYEMDRVPLLIKRPGQKASRILRVPAATLGLKRYIEHFIETGECSDVLLLDSGRAAGSGSVR